MKILRKRQWMIIYTVFAFMVSGHAQEQPLHLSGDIYIDNRFRLQTGDWSWNENRLDLRLDKKFSDKAKFYSDVWLRSFGFPFLTHVEQLFSSNETSPYNIEIREAYVEFYGLFTKNLDVKIGRQRIPWGTADKLNPTDNLNAYDLEDIWDFGRHFGSDAIKAKYYFRDYYIEGDLILFFRPASLPRGDWAEGLYTPPDLPPGFYVNEMTDYLNMPKLDLKENPVYGLKVGGLVGGFDLSASYVYGREGLLVAYLSKLSLANQEGGVDIENYMDYPRLNIVGMDMAGSIGDVGVWAEAATFIPLEAWNLTIDMSASGIPPRDSVLVENKPYLKFVAGMDYTFRGGHYVNFQYLHGFVNERGRGNLNDYFVLDYEKSFFHDKLKVRPATIAFVVSDWQAVFQNYALIYMPFITFMPNDNAEISLGVRIIGGEGNDVFAKYKDKDEFVFSVKYTF